MMYYLLSFFLKILSCIPFKVLYVLSDGLFYVLYYVIRYRRPIVRKNLIESFPEKSEQEILKIEKKFYRFFTDQVLESCKMATISSEEISRRMKFINIEEVNSVFRGGKSIALYMGHFGNWEWVSSIPLCLEKEVKAVQIYHKLRNENMDKIMLRIRERMGAVSVEMRKTARYITKMSAAREVSIVGFIADQSPRVHELHYFLPFLHHHTPVLTGSEKIIKHYGFEARFLKVKRLKRGFYETELILLHDNPQVLSDFELTDLYYQKLEHMIQECPELYLWTHNRFRHAKRLDE